MHEIDEADRRILRVMQADGSLSVTEIAERIGLSQSPCSRRIARLTENGIILGKTIILDRKKLGFNAIILVRIKLSSHGRKSFEQFQQAVLRIPEVQVVQLMLGDYDFNVRVVVRDMDHFHALLQDQLVLLPGVQELQSSVLLDELKYTTQLPL
ncbi:MULTISPECIES: Lrp/AsnC family transcriptional regulator [Salipiger]|uniref:Transcriptional regulator, AsnC family n=1 Tax=Salipiger profundus TaxID=1229727 RepID=A0A1U7DDU7_9RHOB|nr:MULTISPECIES: Lrp/AsnC family transcriptional regulator [Salipiger]APX26331.1 transcriptional regulator, AsnC family [Salipiger profundus]GGA21708.1 AsnC family transcriptional regulator [Salipiger profundus]SFD83485.1 transcriptional regulator, AsnC family [Salipiger profundus]